MQDGISKDIPVFVISSSLQPDDKVMSSKYPFVQDFVGKPVDVKEIERIVSAQSVTGS